MAEMTRRQFLKLGAQLAAVMGLGSSAIPKVAQALEELASGKAPVVWLQGQSCSGCSVSLLNSMAPNIAEVLTSYISLKFHSTVSVATGEVAMEVLNKTLEDKGYILAVEGSVPVGMPEACRVGGETFASQLERAARNANAVIAVGTCASAGGIPAAENNPTGAMSLPGFFTKKGISTPLINVPGCPTHPDWIVGTIVHALKFGLPPLDKSGRPQMFYSRCVHDQCNRYQDYEREAFAKTFGEPGCLFKLGCAGPITHADCPVRHWNGGVNYCINAGAPCIGCASSQFGMKANYPLYTKERAKEIKEV